jgi:DNA mismatch repair protein MSH2
MGTENSLVIIDELGRGTSAVDGLSIALAVKRYLLEKNCYTFFTTHFPEICGDDAVNKAVKTIVKDNEIVLLYTVVDGICDTSFGITVASKVKFPNEVIENAKRYLAEKD